MGVIFIILVLWTLYSIYTNVIKYKDYKYLLVLFISGTILSFMVEGRCWWLFLTLLVTNLYYVYLMVQNLRGILGQLNHIIK